MLRRLSQEAIDYQVKDRFFHDLTKIIERMYNAIDGREYKDNIGLIRSGFGAEVEKLIKKRFNLNVVVDPDISFVAPLAIVPFSSDKLNRMTGGFPHTDNKLFQKLNPYNDSDLQTAIDRFNDILYDNKVMSKKIDGQKGVINKKTATVSGYFAEVKHYMIFNVWFIKEVGGLSAAELAAATIHEIGHAFTGLEYHYRMTTTNVAISEVMNAVNNNDMEKAVYVYRSRFGKEDLEEAKLSKDSTRNDFAGAIAAQMLKKMESQYQSGFHDATTFEYLSDNFATKLGAGKELSTGLDKLNTKFSYGQNRSKHYALISFLDTFLWYMCMCIFGMGVFFGFTWFFGGLFVGVLLNFQTPIYDNYRSRHTRILNEVANILKDLKLPKGEKENLIKQYEIIKSVEAVNYDYKPYQQIIVGMFLPFVRKNNYYVKKQQKIESAMSNSLFVSAAKMTTV